MTNLRFVQSQIPSMGQHRTRQQKQEAQQRRLQLANDGAGVVYTPSTPVKAEKPNVSSVKAVPVQSFLQQDLRRTLMATVVVGVLLALVVFFAR